jgi:DNA-binding transcriptional LysR family regulator
VTLNLYRLQVFRTVVDEQSISRAAERLVVTQPVVSRVVAEIERHYGTPLLVRSGRHVLPTDAGVIVYRYAREILEVTDQTERVVGELVRGEHGSLTMGVTTAIGSYTFPAVWLQFRATHPNTKLVLRLGDSRRVMEDARDGEVDLGLALRSGEAVGVVTEPLGNIELVFVAGAGHPMTKRTISPHELVGETLLCTYGTSNRTNLQRALESWGVTEGYSIEVFGDTETVKRGVEVGLGIAQLARVAVARELAAGTLVELKVTGNFLEGQLMLVQPREQPRSTAVGAFAQFLRGQANALLGRS